MGRQKKGYSEDVSKMQNYILAEYDGDERALSDFFGAVHLNHGKPRKDFKNATCSYVDAEIHRAIREGDSDRIRELADVVEMVASGRWPDPIKQATLIMVERAEEEIKSLSWSEVYRRVSDHLPSQYQDSEGFEKNIQRFIRRLGLK